MARTTIKMSPAEISAKWQRNTKNGQSDMIAGVDRVSENPMEQAVAKQDKMLKNLTEAINKGRWAAGMKKVSLSSWKETTKKKIAERLSSGVDGALPKRQAYDAWAKPVIEAGMALVNGMSDMTLSDSIARMTAMVNHMAKNKYKQ